MMLRVCVLLWVAIVPCSLVAFSQTLDDELQQSTTADLAAQSRLQGDSARGAVVFFQHQMACSRCHSVGGSLPSSLGPDLAMLAKDTTDESLVESVLLPSKVIRKGFDSVTVVTNEGQTIVGLLVERTPDTLVIRDAARNGEQVTLKPADLDDIVQNAASIMPAGQMNQLASRQQFFDL
ncbi:MAG: heme-binding protein, partial [Fuerstia sp.]|nr:heme-binding protein [Fuerstiella sp.]